MAAARWGWPGRSRLALAGLLGLGVGLGQAPFGLWPLALLALAGLLQLIRRAGSVAAGAWVALFAGAAQFALVLSWIVQPFFVDPWRHGWMAPFALVLMAFGMALFWAGAAALALRARWPLMALAVALPLADLLRGHLFTGFPWALFGHIPLGSPLEQLAALVGGYGVGALVVAAAALPLAAPRVGTGLVLAAGVAAFVWGQARQSAPAAAAPGGIVRLVQPNVPQTLKWDPDEARATFDGLLDLTVAPPAGAVPGLAIWPETAVPFLIEEGSGAALAMGSLGLPVAAGYQRSLGDRAWNSLGIFGPGGSIAQSYDKVHLVPFGEYVPAGDLLYRLFGLRAFAAQVGAGYSAGEDARLIDFGPGLGPARPLICYEAIFPEEIATDSRPGWLLQVTNDAWFGTLTGPYQHFALARLRAIEQGLPLVRVANTGISAVVDARGQVVADTLGAPAMLGLGQRGAIDVALPGALPSPPYARLGDWPLVALLLGGLVLAFLAPGRRAGT
ncbi:MAG: apolipoprotein N-acyltransferase [Fuscovulum sp.]|nr:apolipoprotein N-acyltransferase [Fuscovulum sp.]